MLPSCTETDRQLPLGEGLLETILELSCDAIVTVDDKEQIVQFNKGAEVMFGCLREECLGQNLSILIPKTTAETHHQHVEKFKNSGVSSRQTKALSGIYGLRKSGQIFPLEIAVTQFEVSGKTYFTAIARDISARKEAELEKRKSNAVISALMDSAPYGALLFETPAGFGPILRSANKASEKILRENLRLCLGSDISEVLSTRENSDFCEEFVALVNQGQPSFTNLIQRDHGSERVIEVHIIPLHENQVAVFLRDTTEITNAYSETIFGWSKAIDARDHDIEGHCERVTEFSMRLGKEMELSDQQMLALRRGAMLHDIGKIAVPDSILRKPGPLTKEEWEVMKMHPSTAYDMLKDISFLEDAICVPHYHHERWDGTGYPSRLAGDEIPLLARIFAVADVWDAMTSDRPYHAKSEPDEVRDHIVASSGTHFDPQVVEAFQRMISRD